MWYLIIIAVAVFLTLWKLKRGGKTRPRKKAVRAPVPRRASNETIDKVESNFIRLCDEAEQYAQNHALDNHQRSEEILRKKYTAAIRQGEALLKFGGQIGNNLSTNGLVYWAKCHKRDDLIVEFRPLFKAIGVNVDDSIAYWTTGEGGELLAKYDK